MPPVEMKSHELARGLEEACRKMGITVHVTAPHLASHPPHEDSLLQFEGQKVYETVKTEDGRIYEVALEISER